MLKYLGEGQSWSLSQPPTLHASLRPPWLPARQPSPLHQVTVSPARRWAPGWQGPPDCFGGAPEAPGAAPRTSQALGDWSGRRIAQGLAGRDRAAGLRQWKPRRTPRKGLQYATFPKATPAPVWWLVLDKKDAEAAADKGREGDSKEHGREGVSPPQESICTMRLWKHPEVALCDLDRGGTTAACSAP